MMDVDNAPALNPMGDDPVSGTKLEGILSVDEFMANFTAGNAAGEASTTTQQQPSKKAKVAPQPGQGPVAISARTSKHTIALHEKYQALGLSVPSFDYNGSSDYGWTGTVSFPGLDVRELQGIKIDKIYPSKQEAKEALSEVALPILTRLVDEGVVTKMTAETRSKTSKYRVALHDKHQKLGIPQPFFEYTGTTEQGWIATLTFPGIEAFKDTTLKTTYPTRSKQEATEEVSKMAYELTEEAERDGKFTSYAKAKGPSQMQAQEKKGPGPNYTGQLLEFQRAMGSPQPTYIDYQVDGTLFACQVSIESKDSNGAADPTTQLLGSLDAHFTSKKAARQDAARHAIDHFKSLGTWPSNSLDVGGIKKKKPTTTSSTNQDLTSISPSSTTPASPSGSYPQKVQSLAHALSLGTPEWRFTPNPLDRDFHTVACYFAGGGQHAGPIGEVRNVFGKKKAKEECARLTLEYLEEVKKARMAYAEEMLRGIGGSENVLEAAVGREVEGERGVVEGRVGMGGSSGGEEMEMDGDEDSEVEFEDAVETLEVEK